jgi:hypothetical protein
VPTCVVCCVRGAGHAGNALPQKAGAAVYCRILPGVDVATLRDTLAGVVGERSTIATLDDSRARPLPEMRDDLVAAISASVRTRYPGVSVVPCYESGVTAYGAAAAARAPPRYPPPMDRNRKPLWIDALAYPAQGPALLTLVVLSLLRVLAYVPAWGWLLDILLWVAMYRYAADVLWQSANGRDDAPEGYNADTEAGWTLLWTQFVLFTLAIGAGLFLGPGAGVAALVLVAIAMPAVCMSVAMDGDWVHAINPAQWLTVAQRLGRSYAALVVGCLVFAAAQVYAPVVVEQVLPGFVATIVYHFVAQYFVVASFRAMGLTIFRNRKLLDFEPSATLVRVAPRPDPDAELLAEAERCVKLGNAPRAITTLAAAIDARAVSPGVHARYRALLRDAGDRVALDAHAHRLIDIHLAQDKAGDALAVLRDALAADPTFLPRHDEALYALALAARRAGEGPLALRLIEAFRTRHPKHALGVELAVLGGQLLARGGRDVDARALLERARADYAKHARVAEIDAAIAAQSPKRDAAASST